MSAVASGREPSPEQRKGKTALWSASPGPVSIVCGCAHRMPDMDHWRQHRAMHLWQASLSVVGSDYSAIKEADVLHRIDRIVGTQKEEK